MTGEDSITLRGHLQALRATTLERLARLSQDGITDMGLVSMAAHVQTTLEALEESQLEDT